MLSQERKQEMAETLLAQVRRHVKSHDDQTDVLSLIALRNRPAIVDAALVCSGTTSMLPIGDLAEIAELALFAHLGAETVELTDLGRAEAARA
jgi:hypothetical protein